MGNIVPYDYDNVQIESVSKLTDFLSSEPVAQIKPAIKILPNIITDFLNVALEYKKVIINDKQYKQKIDLANKYLDIQEDNIRAKHSIELGKIRSDAQIKMNEIESAHNVSIAQINSDRDTQIERIKSDEKTKVFEIRVQYELAKSQQDNDMAMFREELAESSRRFDIYIRNVKKLTKEKQKMRNELSELLKIISLRIANGTAKKDDYETYKHLTTLKVESFKDTFDITAELINIFSRR